MSKKKKNKIRARADRPAEAAVSSVIRPVRLRPAVVNRVAALLVICAGLTWTWSAGMDLNWDLLNYHFYGAHALLNGRLSQDYFAASFQGYFNPMIYVPFYLMVRAGIPSLVIAFGLALIHMLNVFLAWRLTSSMLAEAAQRSPLLPWLGALLMFVAPLFLTVLGSSFADGLTCIPALWALLILSQEHSRHDWRLEALLAGLLFGIAGGLKLTNAFIAVCACLMAFAMSRAALVQRAQQFVLLGLGGLAGFLLTHGYWSYELYRTFGNPVFPLFNNIFQSPDFIAESHVDRRYVQGLRLWELLLLPLRMLRGASWIYSENPAPDLRPLALFLVTVLAAAMLFLKKRAGAAIAVPYSLRWLTGFYLFSFLIWIFISSNGRYGLPLLLLTGPLLVAWLALLFRDRIALIAGVAILAGQLALQIHGGDLRWGPSVWNTPWIDVEVPRDLRQHPYLFLSTNNQTHALIAPYLHPRSSLVNIIGQYIQPTGDRQPEKLRRLLQRPAEDIRAIFEAKQINGSRVNVRSGAYKFRASPLLGYGFSLAEGNCEVITVRFQLIKGLLIPGRPATPFPDTDGPGSQLVACKLVQVSPEESTKIRGTLAEADKVLDRVEDVCGDQIAPHRTQTAYYYNKPYRNYLNTINQLMYDLGDGTISFVQLESANKLAMGTASAWLSDKPPPCPRLPPVAAPDFFP